MNRMEHTRVEINSRRYEILLNGRLRYHMYREAKHPFFWLLEHPDGTILDRDQYQNDLFERIDNLRYEPNPEFAVRSEMVDQAHRAVNPSYPYQQGMTEAELRADRIDCDLLDIEAEARRMGLPEETHHKCFNCGDYADLCMCDGGIA